MTELKNARITIFLGDDGMRIEISDQDSATQFCDIQINGAADALRALNRAGQVPCVARVRGIGRLGKRQECMVIEFPMPPEAAGLFGDLRKPVAMLAASAYMEEAGLIAQGWIPDNDFGSRESFWRHGGVSYAKTLIRRWVEK